MVTKRLTANVDELQVEFSAPRFFWKMADAYVKAKMEKKVNFVWGRLPQILQKFDAKHPTGHRVPNAGIPIPVSPTNPINPPFAKPLNVMKPTPSQKPRAKTQVPVKQQVPVKPRGTTQMPVSTPDDTIRVNRRDLAEAGPSQKRRKPLSPAPSSDDETPAPVPIKDKGKGKEILKIDEEDHQEGKKRKPPQSTGQVRETTCQRCRRLKIACLDQAGGKACVSCAKIKVKCLPASSSAQSKNTRTASPAIRLPSTKSVPPAPWPVSSPEPTPPASPPAKPKSSKARLAPLLASSTVESRTASPPAKTKTAKKIRPVPVKKTFKSAPIVLTSDDEQVPTFKELAEGAGKCRYCFLKLKLK
jgi:hypothetical protein